jgi:RecJ-like exonuclease
MTVWTRILADFYFCISTVVDSYTRQYGFPSGPGESLHIREDVVEPAQTDDFTSLALGREHHDVVSPHRYIHGVVSCLFHNLVNINDKNF